MSYPEFSAPRVGGGDLPIGQVNAALSPRYGGWTTFARLPRVDEVSRVDVAVIGIPFDAGVSYRPGARFGPNHIRQSSRLLRPYNPAQDISPFEHLHVADAGDLDVNPFTITEALDTVSAAVGAWHSAGTTPLIIGGDHTVALPLLRAAAATHGPVALVHFDAHLDTWDSYFGAAYTHGTPFRRAVEEGLVDTEAICHVGTRGPLYGHKDLADDRRLGFGIISTLDVAREGARYAVEAIRQRVGNRPVYLSIDIDVLDPAHAPGTGTPEIGGLTSRELLEILRGLAGLRIVGGDVVEVSPPYDHAELTGIAGATVAYEIIGLLAHQRRAATEEERQ